MPNHYTTDTISSPDWILTSDLSHVTGMSCPLNDGNVIPRPGFEPGTPRSKRGMMVPFTIGASSEGKGVETSWMYQTAASPCQLPTQTKRPDIARRPALNRHLLGGCGRHQRSGYTNCQARRPAQSLWGFRSVFKNNPKVLIATSMACDRRAMLPPLSCTRETKIRCKRFAFISQIPETKTGLPRVHQSRIHSASRPI